MPAASDGRRGAHIKTINKLKTISGKDFDGGRLIYSENGNPYETAEVYILLKDGLLLGSYISDHSYDGGSSWEVINLNAKNYSKLKHIIKKNHHYNNVKTFIKESFYSAKEGTAEFKDFLKENAIPYEWRFFG